MIGNERLEDESNASSTLTEPISRSIRGINGSRMERGVRILYRHLRSMVFLVLLFSFLMNFTEGGRRIIRHGSAGKVSGECWRLLIISCSCLQTPFFLRGWKRSRRAFRVSRDESISRQRPGISGSGPKGMRTTDRFARDRGYSPTSGMLFDSSIEFGESWSGIARYLVWDNNSSLLAWKRERSRDNFEGRRWLEIIRSSF